LPSQDAELLCSEALPFEPYSLTCSPDGGIIALVGTSNSLALYGRGTEDGCTKSMPLVRFRCTCSCPS
jgi:hypothetical protein